MSRIFAPRFCRSLPLLLVPLVLVACRSARAERPSAMKLFPEESVVFVRMANAHEFGERLSKTGTGRMLKDPQLKPLIEQLYGDVGKLYAEEAEEKMGITWDDLQKLPHGEMAFAVVARPNQRPAFLILIDQGDEPSVVERLVDRALEFAGEKGTEFSTEEIGDVEVTVVRDADQENRMFGVFQRENTIVAATDPNVLRNVLWHWDGGGSPEDARGGAALDESAKDDEANSDRDEGGEAKEDEPFVPGRTLAENDRFVTILKNCRREQDPPPHLIFFVDPIELVRNVGRDNGGVQFAMGLLPALGVDGLLAVGGAMTYSTDRYNEMSQFHVLLENPRAGVMQLPAFEPGDTTPQQFVPLAVETYMGMHWNVGDTYDRLVALVDKYRHEGATEKFVKERISDRLGVDLPTQVLDNLSGRFTWMIGYEKPAKFRGQQHTIAAEVVDEEAMKETIKAVMAKYPDVFEERQFGNVTYHAILPPRLRDMAEEERPAEPCIAVMDGYMFLGGSCKLFERCVAARDGTIDRLVDSEDYARATEVLGRETAGLTPAIFSVSRYEETMRQWYDLLTSEKTRELIEENKEDNRFLAALADALDQHQLPPFDVLAPYLAPGGAILYDTDNGYHGISFTLRNEAE
ncbi:MAG: hypothetical protein L0228_05695 [Planctomycetes bacterium]|nr:hypothetical protein [Planctomycetota bacterium]